MFAIIETGGKQYRVAKGDTIIVDQLGEEAGAKITLDRVLLVADKGVKIGTPVVEGAKVTAKVVDNHKGKKVTAFKYRPRGSAQYPAALGNFDDSGEPRRFRLGLIGSSDIHRAKTCTGHKEVR